MIGDNDNIMSLMEMISEKIKGKPSFRKNGNNRYFYKVASSFMDTFFPKVKWIQVT